MQVRSRRLELFASLELAERAVSHFGVVLDPPLLDNNLRLPQRIENLPIQVLIPQLPAEAA